ncbi:MAG: hypothetical protein K0S70_60 [Microbacterium sp.]|jgi:hypothetical protein|nr:hypothetical protein [Microbacterium sp.]
MLRWTVFLALTTASVTAFLRRAHAIWHGFPLDGVAIPMPHQEDVAARRHRSRSCPAHQRAVKTPCQVTDASNAIRRLANDPEAPADALCRRQ